MTTGMTITISIKVITITITHATEEAGTCQPCSQNS